MENPIALPPLSHQIASAALIVLATTERARGRTTYRVEASWKGGDARGRTLELDIRMHELLGYAPLDAQQVVLFLREDERAGLWPLEILPVVEGAVVYAPDDASVRESLELEALEARVRAST